MEYSEKNEWGGGHGDIRDDAVDAEEIKIERTDSVVSHLKKRISDYDKLLEHAHDKSEKQLLKCKIAMLYMLLNPTSHRLSRSETLDKMTEHGAPGGAYNADQIDAQTFGEAWTSVYADVKSVPK